MSGSGYEERTFDGSFGVVARPNKGREVTCDRRVTGGCVPLAGLVTSVG